MAYQFQLTLTNTSGGAWSVNEAGLKASCEYRNTMNKQFMMIREALGATVSVNPVLSEAIPLRRNCGSAPQSRSEIATALRQLTSAAYPLCLR